MFAETPTGCSRITLCPPVESCERLLRIVRVLAAMSGLFQMSVALAQNAPSQAPKRAEVKRMNSHISIDGILDEPEWSAASSIGEILQREPHPGESATERTEVKLLYDRANLYIGVSCYDSEPTEIVATQMARDADLSVDDRIEILIDSFHDRHNAFYFSTNPLGALVDGLLIENRTVNLDWNAIWLVRTHRSNRGWSAEFAIPFKSIGFKPGEGVWGFNFSRTIKRKIEEDRWASPRLDVKFFQVSEAGEIAGLSEISQGRGLDVRPFVASKALHNVDTGNDIAAKAGVDIFYNITPSLKWTTTFNTDFAETEVDNRQINLTRFPLFFPEKRAFFLENAGVFNFSNTSPEIIPFFSRTIGLLNGNEVPLRAGAKLTGKAGPYSLGVLAVRTGEAEFADGTSTDARNLLVARIKRDLFKQSYIGGLFTDGKPAAPTSSRTFGADLHLFTSRFLGRNQNFGIDAFSLKSANEGVTSKDTSYGFGARYPNDLWDFGINWWHIGKNFAPALGFVPRSNVDKLAIAAEFDPR